MNRDARDERPPRVNQLTGGRTSDRVEHAHGSAIGANQQLSSAYPAANLTGDSRAATFEIVGLSAKRADLSSDAYGDIAAAFNEALVCDPSDVNITTVV